MSSKITNVNLLPHNLFTNIMIIDFNMTSTCMEDRIGGQGDGTNVVEPKFRTGKRKLQITK